MDLTQLLGQQRLAFDADAQRLLVKPGQREDLPATLNTEVSGPNGNSSSVPRSERQ